MRKLLNKILKLLHDFFREKTVFDFWRIWHCEDCGFMVKVPKDRSDGGILRTAICPTCKTEMKEL